VITDLSGLEYCTNLNALHLYSSQVNDLSPLANLTELHLGGNQIRNLSQLLENSELRRGATVSLYFNMLDLSVACSEDREHIGQLEARGAQVRAEFLGC
jgi:Leucine-rich repeat (LRR) protein